MPRARRRSAPSLSPGAAGAALEPAATRADERAAARAETVRDGRLGPVAGGPGDDRLALVEAARDLRERARHEPDVDLLDLRLGVRAHDAHGRSGWWRAAR